MIPLALTFAIQLGSVGQPTDGAVRATPGPIQGALARYVVVVGYNGPADGERPPLTWADDDAARLFRQLSPGARRAWLLTTFDKDSARLWGSLVDAAQPPTKEELAHVLGEAYWSMRDEPAGAELVFVFAGHGGVSPGGEGYALFADGAFTRSDVERQIVAASPARLNHVIVDACAAYFLVARGGDRVVPVTDLAAQLSKPGGADAAQWAHTGVLVATSDAAEVHESSALGGGVFSYLLRSALAGVADADGDGRIEYSEVAAFVAAANAGVDDPRARLQVHAAAPEQAPHAPLADLRTSGADQFLVVDQHGPVRLRVVDSHGLPYAEINREGGGPPVTVALSGNPFYVVERGEEEAVLVPRSPGAYAVSSLVFGKAPAPRSPDPHTALLFSTPFGPAFLHGFAARGDQLLPAAGPAFTVPWAEVGKPASPPPWGTLAVTSLGVAGVLAAGGVVAVVGNSLSLGELDRRFQVTGTLDPALSLQADTWLAAGAILGSGAVAAAVVAGGFALVGNDAEAR